VYGLAASRVTGSGGRRMPRSRIGALCFAFASTSYIGEPRRAARSTIDASTIM
jgi:hypothetical protein